MTMKTLIFLDLGSEHLVDVCHPISCCWSSPFYLAVARPLFRHLPQPFFPFPTLFPPILFSKWNLGPQPLHLLPNSCVGYLIPTTFACHPFCIFLNWKMVLKPSTMEPCRALVKILDSWSHSMVTKSDSLLDGDWLVFMLKLVFRASCTPWSLRTTVLHVGWIVNHSGAQTL